MREEKGAEGKSGELMGGEGAKQEGWHGPILGHHVTSSLRNLWFVRRPGALEPVERGLIGLSCVYRSFI